MSSFFFLLSIISFLGMIVFFLQARRKRRGASKRAWQALAGWLAFFVLSAVTTTPAERQARAAKQETEAQQLAETAPRPSISSDTQTVVTTPDKPAEAIVQPEKAAVPPMPYLAGMTQADLTLNLKNYEWGSWFGEVTPGKCGKYTTSDGGQSDVCMYGQTERIGRIVANVTGSGALAATALPYIATVPFEGSDSASARAWVVANLPKAKMGTSLEKTISGAIYKLYGDPSRSVFLEVEHPDFETWSNQITAQYK